MPACFDFVTTMVHEIGHVLGLGHADDDAGQTAGVGKTWYPQCIRTRGRAPSDVEHARETTDCVSFTKRRRRSKNDLWWKLHTYHMLLFYFLCGFRTSRLALVYSFYCLGLWCVQKHSLYSQKTHRVQKGSRQPTSVQLGPVRTATVVS